MEQHDGIVARDGARTISGVDRAHAFHSVGVQFRGPERADAGRTEHANAEREEVQDLLVPDARSHSEATVHQSHHSGRVGG